MNHIRWVAWGVIEVDNPERFDRLQRRNYLNKIRAELIGKDVKIHFGGSLKNLYYSVEHQFENGVVKKHTFAGRDAIKKACGWILTELGDVSSEDGGVRSAGAEADSAGA